MAHFDPARMGLCVQHENNCFGHPLRQGNVNDINGVILLPDTWSADTYSLSNVNDSGASYSTNAILGEQWSVLEQAGAVFLPAAGNRYGSSVFYTRL